MACQLWGGGINAQVTGFWPDATGSPTTAQTFNLSNALGIGTQNPRAWGEILYCPSITPSTGFAITINDICGGGGNGGNQNGSGGNEVVDPLALPNLLGVVQSMPMAFPTGTGYYSLIGANEDPIFIARTQSAFATLGNTGISGVEKPKFIITPGGKVGVNMANPRANLDIIGTSQNSPVALFGVRSNFKSNRILGGIPLDEHYTKHIAFYSNVTAGFGNSLVTTADQIILFTDGKQASGYNLDGGLVIAPHSASATSGGIRIDKDGAVEIPNLKLNGLISGDLELRGTLTCNGFVSKPKWWPDYVFEDSYNLLSIDSVSHFIRINKHLPGMPSQDEVLLKGQNISELQRLQQQKIEELMLYIINLESEMSIIRQQIIQIKSIK